MVHNLLGGKFCELIWSTILGEMFREKLRVKSENSGVHRSGAKSWGRKGGGKAGVTNWGKSFG